MPTDRSGTHEGSRVGAAWLERHGPDWPGDPLVVIPTARHTYSNAHIRASVERHHSETAATYRGARGRGWAGGPALLLFPDPAVLGWFERHPGVPAICVVQGPRYDTTAWARAHAPEDLTTGRPYGPPPALDPVVAAALASVAGSRHWRGLMSADDVSLTVRSLRLLQEHGHPVEPGEVEAWALADGWRPAVAARLADYASRVVEGRIIALRSLVGPPHGALARWRRAAGS